MSLGRIPDIRERAEYLYLECDGNITMLELAMLLRAEGYQDVNPGSLAVWKKRDEWDKLVISEKAIGAAVDGARQLADIVGGMPVLNEVPLTAEENKSLSPTMRELMEESISLTFDTATLMRSKLDKINIATPSQLSTVAHSFALMAEISIKLADTYMRIRESMSDDLTPKVIDGDVNSPRVAHSNVIQAMEAFRKEQK